MSRTKYSMSCFFERCMLRLGPRPWGVLRPCPRPLNVMFPIELWLIILAILLPPPVDWLASDARWVIILLNPFAWNALPLAIFHLLQLLVQVVDFLELLFERLQLFLA